MDPISIIGIATTILPQLARWVFGDGAGDTAQKVADVVQTVTGTSDATEAKKLIEADPAKYQELQLALAKLAAEREAAANAAHLEEIKAAVADTVSARQQTVDLAKAGSAIAWGAAIVSVIVLVTFGVVLYCVLTKAMPPGSEQVANVLLGYLGGMATAVVGYWVGSSAGSAQKTSLLASAAGGGK